MFLRFEDNPNTGFVEDRVWKEQGTPRRVEAVLRSREGREVWCRITGLNERGQPVPASGVKVEDSGEGTCWLIYGGLWGLRLADSDSAWSLDDRSQWAEPFLLLPPDGSDIRFVTPDA